RRRDRPSSDVGGALHSAWVPRTGLSPVSRAHLTMAKLMSRGTPQPGIPLSDAPPPPPPILELRDVARRYGSVNAVDQVSLIVQPGEVFTLLAPSGCGKSTTLRIVAGLEEPDGGEVLLDGR